jgi:hypothetical protein
MKECRTTLRTKKCNETPFLHLTLVACSPEI